MRLGGTAHAVVTTTRWNGLVDVDSMVPNGANSQYFRTMNPEVASLPVRISTSAAQVSPLALAEAGRSQVAADGNKERQSELGQYFTPAPVAQLMATMFEELPENVHLLDAGAGAGALSAAFVSEACRRARPPRSIHVSAFEIDRAQLRSLEATLIACGALCEPSGVAFSYTIHSQDFILAATSPLFLAREFPKQVNCAILNPPYQKIRADSTASIALRSVGLETGNLYSAFVALATDLLANTGQIVAITPRSFCNGPYFLRFRRWMFERAVLNAAHLFEYRDAAFADDSVLQENVIVRFSRSSVQPEHVLVGTSTGRHSDPIRRERIPFSEIVQPSDPNVFIRLALSDEDVKEAERIRRLPARLNDLGLQVSTGRVVDFRVREHLKPEPEETSVPLIYAFNLANGRVDLSRRHPKKASAISRTPDTSSLLIPAGFYVLTKRFTSKEERRRVVAAVLEPSDAPYDVIGVENHLNYFHARGEGTDRELAYGLAHYLNSSAVDRYFRQFSGHTQVNATDLRSLHFPSAGTLRQLARELGLAQVSQEALDAAMELLL